MLFGVFTSLVQTEGEPPVSGPKYLPTYCGRISVVIRNRCGCRISCLWPCEGYECRAEIDIFDSLVALSLPAMAVNLVVFEE